MLGTCGVSSTEGIYRSIFDSTSKLAVELEKIRVILALLFFQGLFKLSPVALQSPKKKFGFANEASCGPVCRFTEFVSAPFPRTGYYPFHFGWPR